MSSIEYGYKRFATERFSLPTERQLTAIEDRLRARFPDNYRRFVLEFNGGCFNEPCIMPVVEDCPLDGLTHLNGIEATHECCELGRERDVLLFDDNNPIRILPIGDTALGGLIVISLEERSSGEIYLKKAFGDFYFLAGGIEEFFDLLVDSDEVYGSDSH